MRIEIGTSDFRTEAGITPGVYIEPVKYYFDRLPDCNKLNAAISDKNGTAVVYYLTDDEIELHNLPKWIRGCNSINKPHPTVLKTLRFRGIDPGIIREHIIPVMRIKQVIDDFGINEIDTLKIDTEGHDLVILNDFLNTVSIRPDLIIFEANELSNARDVYEMAKRLRQSFGYKITQTKTDIFARK